MTQPFNPFDMPELSPAQFKKFADLAYREAFIYLKANKVTLLTNRIRKRLRELRLSDYDEYYNFVTHNDAELLKFVEVVTTNESYFWRGSKNFDMLKESILPILLRNFPGAILRFWSAGCSTGEEPYNLAIELTEAMVTSGPFSFRITASDISERVVHFAREGRYSGRKIEKIPPKILNRYFLNSPDDPGIYRVRDDIKRRIEFHVENLFEATPYQMHMIFCRNAMIYFNFDDQKKLINRFYDLLLPGGFLVVGHSESLHGMGTHFETFHFPNGLAYQKPLHGKTDSLSA